MKRLIVVLFVGCGLLLACSAVRADFWDEFPGPPLNPGWRISNQDSTHWSLTAQPGYLQILTQFYASNGTMMNFFFHRESIPGDWEVSTRIVARPDSVGQAALFFAEYDSTHTGQPNALVLFGNVEGFWVVDGAIGGGTGGYALYSDTMVYLRVRKQGDTAFAEYSPNGSSWTILDQGYPFPSLYVSGVCAANMEDLGATAQTPAMAANYDWFHLTALTGVEAGGGRAPARGMRAFQASPNPFASFARVPGHEGERFALYDISGRQVGNFPGDRIGEGLAPGVYFLRGTGNGSAASVRIVKVR